jgi:hypothetical protein
MTMSEMKETQEKEKINPKKEVINIAFTLNEIHALYSFIKQMEGKGRKFTDWRWRQRLDSAVGKLSREMNKYDQVVETDDKK